MRTRSIQFQKLIDKLRAAGCSPLIQSQDKIDGARMTKLRIQRDGKSPVLAVVIDTYEDGYQLFLMAPSIKIDDDVARVLAQD
jgi:hypothetical protein